MKKSLLLSLLAIVLIGASCSKQKKIERRLTKKDGVWTVAQMSESSVTGGTTDYNNNFTNAGTITFDENNFVWNVVTPDDNYTFGGTWSNTENAISFVADGEGITYKIDSESKKEIRLSWTQTYEFGGSTTVDKSNLVLKRD